MARVGVLGALVLAALAVVAQIALPSIAEQRIEDRLTEGGGAAEVSVEALPALRLLADDGDRISVRGEGLVLDLDQEDPEVMRRLDGFGEVDVELSSFEAGPFAVESFVLERSGEGPYRLESRATTSAAELVGFGADRLDLAGAGLLQFLAGRLEGADRPLPVVLDMELESDAGRILVVSGGGTVAGVPTGPLAELLTAAIVVRL